MPVARTPNGIFRSIRFGPQDNVSRHLDWPIRSLHIVPRTCDPGAKLEFSPFLQYLVCIRIIKAARVSGLKCASGHGIQFARKFEADPTKRGGQTLPINSNNPVGIQSGQEGET
jgi:hypothetical protein